MCIKNVAIILGKEVLQLFLKKNIATFCMNFLNVTTFGTKEKVKEPLQLEIKKKSYSYALHVECSVHDTYAFCANEQTHLYQIILK